MFQMTFPCFRKHILLNSNYQLRLFDNHFTIQLLNTKPKYEVQLTLYQCIHFTFEQEQLVLFGFEYNNKLKLFNADPQDIQKFKQAIKCKVMFREIQSFYSPVDLLGKGGTSKVYQVVHKSTQQFYASKCIDKKLIQEEGEEVTHFIKKKAGLFNEIKIMASMKHDKIIGIEDVFVGDQTYYLILEYLKGNSLNELISRRQSSFQQDQIQLIIKQIKQKHSQKKQILEALAYIHYKGIMHRDLKPENVMFKDHFKLETLKLIDFGLATFIDVDRFPFPKCGTPGYVAPEIANLKDLHQKYSSVCDVFSAGCIFFRLCTGKELFPGGDFHDILKINKKCNINLENLSLYRTPPEAVDLLQKMLKVNPLNRITAQDALNHEYFQKTFDTKKSKFQQPQKKDNPISQTTNFNVQKEVEENCDQVEDENNHFFKVPIMTIKKQQQNALLQMKQKKMKKYLTTEFHDPLFTQN